MAIVEYALLQMFGTTEQNRSREIRIFFGLIPVSA